MGKTLFVTDLDGTLLDSGGYISDRSAMLLNRAMSSGALVSFATSRSWNAALEALRGFVPNAPCVASGGVVVADPSDGRIMRNLTLDRATAVSAVEAMLESGVIPFVKVRGNGREERVYFRQPNHPGQEAYLRSRLASGQPRLFRVFDYGNFSDGWVVVIFSVDEAGKIARTLDSLRRLRSGPLAFECISFGDPYTGYDWLEVLPAGADKGSASRFVADVVGADRIVCFGDGGNDAPLFEKADHAVAVANAHPDLVEVADERIGHADGDAVAEYIAKACGLSLD